MEKISKEEKKRLKEEKKLQKEMVKEKMSFTHKLICVVLAISIIMCTITAILIVLNTDNNAQNIITGKVSTSQVPNYDNVKRLNLTDKFYINPITFKNNKENLKRDGNKDTISFTQIDGLVNKNIQNSINTKIKDAAYEAYNKVLDNYKAKYGAKKLKKLETDVDTFVTFNMGNILSLEVDACSSRGGENPEQIEDLYNYNGITFSLVSGEEIDFADLFTEDANINTLVASSLYNSLSWEYVQNGETETSDISKIDYSTIENRVYDYMLNYRELVRNNQKIDYYIGGRTISVINVKTDEDYPIFGIDMRDNIEYANIYFIDENTDGIYENDFREDSKLYAFEETWGENQIYEIETEDMFIKFDVLDVSEDDSSLEAKEKKILEDNIEKYTEEIKNYKTKVCKANDYYIVSGTVSVGHNKENNKIECSLSLNGYMIDKSLYNEVHDMLVKSLTDDKVEAVSINIYYDSEDPKYKSWDDKFYTFYTTITYSYNLKTLKEENREIDEYNSRDNNEDENLEEEPLNNNDENTIIDTVENTIQEVNEINNKNVVENTVNDNNEYSNNTIENNTLLEENNV